jgi:hypothetical protein
MATRRTADGFKISCLSSTLLHLTLNVYFNENNVPSDYWVLESLKKITKNGETLVLTEFLVDIFVKALETS